MLVPEKTKVKCYITFDLVNKKAWCLGEGTYMGCEEPPKEVQENYVGAYPKGETNPKIQLDTGETVWGCQCWWSLKETSERELEDYQIINVTMEEFNDGTWRQKNG